jgi:hypothetical protein
MPRNQMRPRARATRRKRVDPALGAPWDERHRGTRIVVIGAEGAVDAEALRAVFDGCVAG